MKFELMDFLMNPFVLMFAAVITGILFGKIKFGKFNFGVSGALTSSPGLAAALETAGKHAEDVSKEFEKASIEDKKEILKVVDPEGKLDVATTTSLTQEQIDKYIAYAEAGVGIGHAVAYPFGVLIVILGVNFLPKIFRMDLREERKKYEKEMKEARDSVGGKMISEIPFNIITFFLTCLAGYLVGGIHVFMGPLGYFTLGATGGSLIVSLVLGYIGQIGVVNFRMEEKVLNILKQIGLVFF